MFRGRACLEMPVFWAGADIGHGGGSLVVDGRKRVLWRLQRDTMAAVMWELPEAEALIFRHPAHRRDRQRVRAGSLLRALHEQHGGPAIRSQPRDPACTRRLKRFNHMNTKSSARAGFHTDSAYSSCRWRVPRQPKVCS
jgi:hypothetical protein